MVDASPLCRWDLSIPPNDDHFSSDLTLKPSPSPNPLYSPKPIFTPIMSASAFTQSPRTSFKSVSFDDDIHAAASTCKGVQNQVADIKAFLIKELGCAVFPERRRSPVYEPIFFHINHCKRHHVLHSGHWSRHILVIRLDETDPCVGAA